MVERLAARIGPSRRDEVERKIMAPLKILGLTDQDKYEDQSKILYDFGDGWTIRKLMTRGDLAREGELMSNCIGQDYRWSIMQRCEYSHGPRGRKNPMGTCATCRDTGYNMFVSCNQCQRYSCSASSCGNSRTKHENPCNDWGHTTRIKIPRPQFKKKNGQCTACQGTLLVAGRSSLLQPYSLKYYEDDYRIGDDIAPRMSAFGEGFYVSLRDPNNVPKISAKITGKPSRCQYHFEQDDHYCHTHGLNGCCAECGGTDPKDAKNHGYKVLEIGGRGNAEAEPEYKQYFYAWFKNLDKDQKSEPVTETETKPETKPVTETQGQKTMQQMLGQAQKRLRKPLTPNDIHALREIVAKNGWRSVKKAFVTPVAACRKCGSANMNYPSVYHESGMSLCLDCGAFNELA